MKHGLILLAASVMYVTSSVQADYSVTDRGEWPETWPKALESLRGQARTLEGPLAPQLHYQIPFTAREQFEAAWPHLLKVASQGAPLVLLKSPYTRLGKIDAGVFVHTPVRSIDKLKEFADKVNANDYRINSTYIELIVDGKIVDLNRIPLPPGTTIIDKRFDRKENLSQKRKDN